MGLNEVGTLSCCGKWYRFYSYDNINIQDGSTLLLQPWSELDEDTGIESFHLSIYENGEILDSTDERLWKLYYGKAGPDFAFSSLQELQNFIETLKLYITPT
jgi:hypothetical protein